jgi:hypothetical protein
MRTRQRLVIWISKAALRLKVMVPQLMRIPLTAFLKLWGGANITLKNLNLDQGEALEGGVIYNRSRLTLNNVQTAGIVRSEGSAEGRGGAIYNAGSGRIVAQDSSIQGASLRSEWRQWNYEFSR